MVKKKKNNPDISIVIIAKNEEKMIVGAIKSSLWAKEIIVLDTGSTDKTTKIAKDMGAKIVSMPTEGLSFADWRTAAIAEVCTNWIYYLDCDERFTKTVKEEILEIVRNKPENKLVCYAVPRANYYLGKRVKRGGSWPDYVKRLLYKPALKKWTGRLHEEPVYDGKLAHLKNPIEHFTHKNITSMVQKTIKWSVVEAELLFNAGHPPVVWWRFIRMMFTKAWERIVKQQAWRDGTVGWINSIFEMFNTFIIYARLWEIQQVKKKK